MADLAQAVANLTNRFNQFIGNAKKVDELDPQEVLNSSSKLHVMIDGVSQYLTVQQILDAFVQKTFKELVSVGGISLDSEQITLTDIVWKLEDVSFTKSKQIDIPLTLTGNIRNDIFVGDDTGEIIRIAGIESNSIAITPTTPYNAVFITQVTVTDTGVDDPEPPVIGNIYVEKEYLSIQDLEGSGVINTINMDGKKGGLAVTGTVEELGGIQKNSSNYIIGQFFWVGNFKNTKLKLKNLNPASNHKFSFPDNLDYDLNPWEIAPFVLAEFGIYRFVGTKPVVRRTETFRFVFTGTFAANTSWVAYERGTNIFNPNVLVNDSYNNTTRVLNDGRAPAFIVPYNCRIKRVYWQAGTYSNPITLNVHTFNIASGSTTANNQTVASKEIPLLSAGVVVEYAGAEVDKTSIIPAGKHLTALMFNNNLSVGQMRFNCLNVEIEEAL